MTNSVITLTVSSIDSKKIHDKIILIDGYDGLMTMECNIQFYLYSSSPRFVYEQINEIISENAIVDYNLSVEDDEDDLWSTLD